MFLFVKISSKLIHNEGSFFFNSGIRNYGITKLFLLDVKELTFLNISKKAKNLTYINSMFA